MKNFSIKIIVYLCNFIFFGLLLSFFFAWILSYNKLAFIFILEKKLFLFLLSILIIFYLYKKNNEINKIYIILIFTCFSLLNGLTLSVVFLLFSINFIIFSLLFCLFVFFMFLFFIYFFKKKLNEKKNFIIVGIIGILSSYSIYLLSRYDEIQFIVSCTTLLLFTYITLNDNIKIINLFINKQKKLNTKSFNKQSVFVGLNYYINFILIFEHILYIISYN